MPYICTPSITSITSLPVCPCPLCNINSLHPSLIPSRASILPVLTTATLLFGLWQKSLHKFQSVQNSAARIIARTPSPHHITPNLQRLHWLPVKQRIQFKLLVIVIVLVLPLILLFYCHCNMLHKNFMEHMGEKKRGKKLLLIPLGDNYSVHPGGGATSPTPLKHSNLRRRCIINALDKNMDNLGTACDENSPDLN